MFQRILSIGTLWICFFIFTPLCNAQFKHSSISVHLGLQNTFNQDGNPTADAGTLQRMGYGVGISYFDLGIDYSYKFIERFAFVGEAHLSVHQCGKGTGEVCDNGSTPMMINVFTKIRAFLLTDDVRPFFDLGLGYWRSIAFVKTDINAFGPTVSFGLDWFFKEDLAIGFRIQYGLQLFVGSNSLAPFHQLAFMLTFTTFP